MLAGKAATDGVPAEFERPRTCWASRPPPRAIRPAQGLVGLPDAVRPRPADRAADAHVAQPLRHQQPQGQQPRVHAPAERAVPPTRPGPFGELLGAVVHDPALLIWLDAPSNRKGHPNENLARELMELFTLGIGHYTEQDVKEAAAP